MFLAKGIISRKDGRGGAALALRHAGHSFRVRWKLGLFGKTEAFAPTSTREFAGRAVGMSRYSP